MDKRTSLYRTRTNCPQCELINKNKATYYEYHLCSKPESSGEMEVADKNDKNIIVIICLILTICAVIGCGIFTVYQIIIHNRLRKSLNTNPHNNK